jgi:hypothetical protein
MGDASTVTNDRQAILTACQLVRDEPSVAALTVGLARPELFRPHELERYCARLAASEGVDIEILPGAQSVRVAPRRVR